ncbi:Rrf2 family transcriptional regulator [Oscillatoria amoena NRMC-F 0135]|nr:Rrf2 family transcriptional regulator [Oscillatoria amoena NRMC-F 0135]MDL5053471.1 Rrf2 family transcriptional regulator [Oscillatoria laete-virens NRMC-F 0139]
MTAYGKGTATAVSAMSVLAELYSDPTARASAPQIAQLRNLSRPLVAKILTVVSKAGLIEGTPGPRGGYRLTRPPRSISLYEIAKLFEQVEGEIQCPYGPDWCGHHKPCPLHDTLLEFHDQMMERLKGTTLSGFCKT